jgi:serine/threonine protein kinase
MVSLTTVYCINPNCDRRDNPDDAEVCLSCGTSLIINDRIRLIRPIRLLSEDPFAYHTEIFEIDDEGSEWHDQAHWQNRRILKVLTWNRPELLSLFEREAQALQCLDHPGIPHSTIDDFFTFQPTSAPKLYCLAMNQIRGENLDQWVQTHGKISQSLAVDWLLQLFFILDYVHRSGYFHRDIKPSNIVVQPSRQLALIDFGGVREVTTTYLAKLRSGGKTDIRHHNITGVRTPRFSPLEQIDGQAVPQSDFFSVGRTLVYCVTGIQLIDLPKNLNTGKLIWRDKAPHIDRPLADFLDELMATFPGQRPQTTQIILHRLKRLPLRSKIHRIVHSKAFVATAIVLGIAVGVGSYKLLTYAASQYYFNLASRNQERPPLAKKYYQKAISYNPHDSDAYNNLAITCQQLGDWNCVQSAYQSLFQLEPFSWEGYYGYGVFYDEQGKYDLAQQLYQKAIHVNPHAVMAINNLSRLKNLSGDYPAAIALVYQGLRFARSGDDQSSLYKNLGWAKLGQKIYPIAQSHLKTAIALDPQKTDAYCLLAQAQEALGENHNARLSWETCLISQSSLPEVQNWRQQILQRILPSK